MKNEEIKELIRKKIKEITEDENFEKTIKKLIKRNEDKMNFMPLKFQVVSGFLQSLNIRFIKFIEKFIIEIINYENKYIVHELSQKEIYVHAFASEDQKITKYINKIKNNKNYSKENFEELINFKILEDNSLKESTKEREKIEIDLLISDKNKNNYFYFEIKGKDDHDSGKFENINRKLFHNYFGLKRYFIENNINFETITPKLIYFNNLRKKNNLFLGEGENVYRGREFWEKYTNINFEEIQMIITKIKEDEQIIKYFENLITKIILIISKK